MPSAFARPNKFNRSHTNLLTCEMGKLVPFYVEEVLPGDEFRVKTDAIIRLAPMLAPIFGEVDFYTHYFFVPNRLLWKNWEEFITNGLENGTTDVVAPYVQGDTSTMTLGSLADYIGLPVGDSAGSSGASVSGVNGHTFSALPFRAYAKIWNDWYRNEYLQNEIPLSLEDGADTTTNVTLQSRCWPRDYFTSALPFTQLGEAVTLPVGADSAPVSVFGNGKVLGLTSTGSNNVGLTTSGYSSSHYFVAQGSSIPTGDLPQTLSTQSLGDNHALGVHPDSTKSGLVGIADLSSAFAATVNDVRTAFQLQRLMERKARSGNRYVEYLASSFGVRSPDARLQRAEFLGGGKSPVMISEVLQTSAATSTSPQGQMTGHGFGAARTHAFNKAFTEHGYIMGILSVMPKTSYFQGRERALHRYSYTDYYQPEFAHLGEQAVYDTEVVCASTVDSGDIFGYQPRYEEYRRKLSSVHGDYRKNLDYWHLARAFATADVPLNAEFVQSNPTKRIFAAGDQADRPCWIEMFLNVKAIRPMPKHGNPGFIDH